MLPRRYIERYLFFLLRHRWPVIALVGLASVCFLYSALFLLTVFTNFFDLYPPGHPYIRLYAQYREMFGTANVVLITLEVKDGDIFSSPETIRKVDRITLDLLHDVPGVNGEQVMSITHPKLKTALTAGSGISVSTRRRVAGRIAAARANSTAASRSAELLITLTWFAPACRIADVT